MNFEPTQTKVAILLYAADPASLTPTYTHIQVLRSLTEDGPFTPITDQVASKASIRAGRIGEYLLQDTIINLLLEDGNTLSHQFVGPDPMTAAAAALELNSASPLLDCYDDAGTLVLRTVTASNKAFIKLDGGDALHWLGMHVNDVSYGLSTNPLLVFVPPTYSYLSYDLNGSLDYAYRYRFVNPAPPANSPLMRPVAIGRDLTIDIVHLAIGTIKASQLSGVSDFQNRVHVENRYVPPDINNTLINGDQVVEFDPSGVAAVTLLRGSKVEFYVPGSPVHRIIQVPNLPTFDMLDPALVQDDTWGIVTYPYDSLPRTTP